MNVPFSFPVSPDDFAAYQEKLHGEPILHQMREALNAWVPVLNGVYHDGLKNDHAALECQLKRMDCFIEQNSTSPNLVKFLETAKSWIVYAWGQGRAQHE